VMTARYETVLEWFDKAIANARAMGKTDRPCYGVMASIIWNLCVSSATNCWLRYTGWKYQPIRLITAMSRCQATLPALCKAFVMMPKQLVNALPTSRPNHEIHIHLLMWS
jgi:hypothetical protein